MDDKKIEMDSFLEQYSQGNQQLKDALTPDFGAIEARALRQVNRGRRVVGHALRAAAVAVVLLGAFAAGVFLSDSTGALAYRHRIEGLFDLKNKEGVIVDQGKSTAYTQLEDAQKKVPFTLTQPHWLPEGYALAEVTVTQMGDGTYSVASAYQDSRGNKLGITQYNGDALAHKVPLDDVSQYKTLDLQGTTVYMRQSTADAGVMTAEYVNKRGLLVAAFISGDEQTLTKVLMGLY